MDGNTTLLVIDDETSARAVLTGLLKAEGYQVEQAANGPDGLARAAQCVPDAILLDVMMPGMDGFEVCRRLRADARLGLVPIVMITALDDRDSRLEGITAGADDFITKPFDSLELAARLQTISRLNRYRRLLAQQSRFEWIVGKSADGYLVLDADNNITYANPTARLYLELPSEGAAGNFLVAARRRYNLEPAVAWQSSPAPCPSSTRFLVRPETDAAPALWLQVEKIEQPIGDTNEQLVCLRDVSSQVTAGSQIRSFHALVAHKLRTPLLGWTGSLDLLASAAEARGDAELEELALLALRSAQRVQDDVSSVLTYIETASEPGRGLGMPVSKLQPIAEQIACDLGIPSFACRLEKVSAAAWWPLSAQTTELLLRELIENSEKFHPRGEPIVEVSVSPLHPCGADGAPGWLRLRVADDGATLTPEQLAQAWSPYYQGERWFTGQCAGMGLGLPTVATAVCGAGGTCRLYNRPDGPGVVVELDLPCAPAPAE